LIEELGAKNALCMALAYISGQTTKINKRSLLTGQEGYETFELKTDTEIRSNTFAYNLLNKIITDTVSDKIVNMKTIASKLGVVFDLPEKESKAL